MDNLPLLKEVPQNLGAKVLIRALTKTTQMHFWGRLCGATEKPAA